MITTVAQTLADILVESSSLIKKSQIDLSHPGKRRDLRPALSLYLYDLRQSQMGNCQKSEHYSNNTIDNCNLKENKVNSTVFWYDLSFVIIAWDWTNIGEQRLLSETLSVLLRHQSIDEQKLPSELKGYGDLSLEINTSNIDVTKFWSALKVPLQPALYITVRIPVGVVYRNDDFTSKETIIAN